MLLKKIRKHFKVGEIEILCDTEERAEMLAEFLESLGINTCNGYYDQEDGLDEREGWYWVQIF